MNFRQYGFGGHTIVVTGKWVNSFGAQIVVCNMETGILSVTTTSIDDLSKYFLNTRQQCEIVLEKMAKGIQATL